MKKAFITHGLLLMDKDYAIIIGDNPSPVEVEVPESVELIEPDSTYITPDFNNHNEIEVTISVLSMIELEDIQDNGSVFFVGVDLFEGEVAICEVKDRNFKLEHLSMELQKRIHDKAEEMYQDWLKVKRD